MRLWRPSPRSKSRRSRRSKPTCETPVRREFSNVVRRICATMLGLSGFCGGRFVRVAKRPSSRRRSCFPAALRRRRSRTCSLAGWYALSRRALTRMGASSAAMAATSTFVIPCFMVFDGPRRSLLAPVPCPLGIPGGSRRARARVLKSNRPRRGVAQEKGRDSKDGKESRGDGKDSDYEFIPPDFDEDAFIHRELVSFRTTLILFLWAIVAAAVSWAAFAGMGGADTGWLVGLAIAAAFFLGLKRIFALLKVDIAHFGRKEWLGTAALYFFTWLSFFIIAINPPVSDFAPPRVEVLPAPHAQLADGTVSVHLFVE